MNKNDLIAKVAENSGFTKKNAASAIEAVSAAILEGLKNGEKVVLPGIGSFEINERAAREGRNPGTGAVIKIPAKKVAKFKAAKALKDSLAD